MPACPLGAAVLDAFGRVPLQAPVQTRSPSPVSGPALYSCRGHGGKATRAGPQQAVPVTRRLLWGKRCLRHPQAGIHGLKPCRVLGPLPGWGCPRVWPGDPCEVTVFLRNLSSALRAASHSHPGSGAPAVPL